MLWHNGINSVSAALGPGSIPSPAHWLRIWHCRSCGIGHDCNSYLIPGLGSLYATGWPKNKNKKNNQEKFWSPTLFFFFLTKKGALTREAHFFACHSSDDFQTIVWHLVCRYASGAKDKEGSSGFLGFF